MRIPCSAGRRRDPTDFSELDAVGKDAAAVGMDATTVGMDAAVDAMGYMEWCCSVGLVAVYAEVRLRQGGYAHFHYRY